MDRTVGWVLASIALVGAAVLRVSASDEEHSTSYEAGAVTGSLPAETERVTARAVLRGGEPAAAVLVIEMPEGNGGEDELFAGFEEEAQGKAEDARLGGARARLFRAPDGGASLVGMSAPCAATLILGVSPAITRELAGDLPVEG